MNADREQPLRKSEQGDELSEEHAIGSSDERPDSPYLPPRQPAQEQPGESGGDDEARGA